MSNVRLAADIVAAYVENNRVRADELPAVIRAVHRALIGIEEPEAEAKPEMEPPTAAQIRRSMRPDALVSFVDGRPYKSLKRHLTGHGLTPETYRERYGLPASYPMVAPEYSAARSALAKSIGLGQGGRKPPGKRSSKKRA